MPACDLLLEVAVGGGDHAHVDADVGQAADALERLLLEDAQQLGLQRQRSSRRSRRGTRCRRRPVSNRPRFCCRASVNAPRSWPKSSLSSSCSGSADAVDVDERPGRPRAVVVDGLGREVLAGAGLAGQQHGRGRAGRHLAPAAPSPASSPASRRRWRRTRSRAPWLLRSATHLAPQRQVSSAFSASSSTSSRLNGLLT